MSYKKSFILFFHALLCVNLCSCGNQTETCVPISETTFIEDETRAEQAYISENPMNANDVYIDVREMFFYRDGSNNVDFDGKAYVDNLENNLLEFIYCNNDNFFHCYKNTPLSNKIYSGTYETSKDNQLIFNYENSFGNNYEKNEKWDFSIYDNPNENRITSAHVSNMKSANRNNYTMEIYSTFNVYDKMQYMYAPYCLNYYDDKYSWHEFKWTYSYNVKVYLKNDFIVAEQKGYYFDQINHNANDFVIKYNNSEFSTGDYCDMRIKFNRNGTYEITSCNEYCGYAGKWDLFENHLLMIHVPDEEAFVGNDEAFNLLYVDFNSGEIALPLFMKCDDVQEEVESFIMTQTIQ